MCRTARGSQENLELIFRPLSGPTSLVGPKLVLTQTTASRVQERYPSPKKLPAPRVSPKSSDRNFNRQSL